MNLLTQDLLNKAVTIAQEEADRWGGNTAFVISGSRVDGFGNSTSDLDAYVITSEISPKEGAEESVIVCGVRIEISWIGIANLRKKLVEVGTSLGEAEAARVDMYSALLAHRMFSGIILRTSCEFEDVMNSVSKRSLASNLRILYRGHSFDKFEDALGAFADGDFDTAGLAIQRAVSYALDTALAAVGDTNPLAKWRLKRADIALAAYPAIKNSVRAVIFPFLDPTIKGLKDFFLAASKTFRKLHEFSICEAYTLPHPERKLPFVRTDYVYLQDQRGKLFLIGQKGAAEVSREVASVWMRMCDTTDGFTPVETSTREILGRDRELAEIIVKRGCAQFIQECA